MSIRTDGGPQFRAPHIRHELASAYHHKSNGHAECALREVKKLLAKTPSYTAFHPALRSYRNCPDRALPNYTLAEDSERTRSHSQPHTTAYQMPLLLCTKARGGRRQESYGLMQTKSHAIECNYNLDSTLSHNTC